MSDFKTIFKENYKEHEILVKQSPAMGEFVKQHLVAYVQVVPNDRAYTYAKRGDSKLSLKYFPLELHYCLDVIEHDDGKTYLAFDNYEIHDENLLPWGAANMLHLAKYMVDNIMRGNHLQEQKKD